MFNSHNSRDPDNLTVVLLSVAALMCCLAVGLLIFHAPKGAVNTELFSVRVIYENVDQSRRVLIGFPGGSHGLSLVMKVEEADEVENTSSEKTYTLIEGEYLEMDDSPTIKQLNKMQELKSKYIDIANEREEKETILNQIIEVANREIMQEDIENVKEQEQSFVEPVAVQEEVIQKEESKETSISVMIAKIILFLLFTVVIGYALGRFLALY